jgi:BASS family bile acid:Na+ symporter
VEGNALTAAEINSFQIKLGGASEIGLGLMLALMMFAVALGLRSEHFRFFRERPGDFLGGVIAQIIGLPLLTIGLLYALNPLPSFALGMIVVACCPGGNVSNLLSLFGRANTALSVSLTATSSVAAAFITPLSILFWSSLYGPTAQLLSEINFNVGKFLLQALIILALPLVLGMWIAARTPERAAKLQKPLALLGGAGLAAIIIIGTMKYWSLLLTIGAMIVPLVVVHNGLALGLGFGTGLLVGSDTPSRRALTIEVGIQNSGLGLIILLTQLNGLGGAAIITAMWGIWHIISGGIIAGLFRFGERRRRQNV